MRIFLTIATGYMSVALAVYAHSGRTDSGGGHTISATGEYHYHHGFTAHDHSHGACPLLVVQPQQWQNTVAQTYLGIIVPGQIGEVVAIEAREANTEWKRVDTVTLADSEIIWGDIDVTHDSRFYRVVAVSVPFWSLFSPPPPPKKLGCAFYAGLIIRAEIDFVFAIEAKDEETESNWQSMATINLKNSVQLWLDPRSQTAKTRMYRVILLGKRYQ